MDEIFQMQAEVLKALSSPRRLEIIHLLAEGPQEVGRLAEAMGVSQPNVSQHLALMRAVGVVDFEREGREVRYRLVDPRILQACELMRNVLTRRLARLANLTEVADERLRSGTAADPDPELPAQSHPSAPAAVSR